MRQWFLPPTTKGGFHLRHMKIVIAFLVGIGVGIYIWAHISFTLPSCYEPAGYVCRDPDPWHILDQ